VEEMSHKCEETKERVKKEGGRSLREGTYHRNQSLSGREG